MVAFVCPHAADFELSSELFIVRRDVYGKIGLHYYRWYDRKFTLLQVDEHCGDWTGILVLSGSCRQRCPRTMPAFWVRHSRPTV